jgi:myosin I
VASRFGKYVKIQFGKEGRIVGAEITNYLLEKTRIVRHAMHERNYHIFYQLLEGADDTLLQRLGLTRDPRNYRYLAQVGS